ncbi:MAG: phospho-sugar mutase [Bacteroidales bacterium]
MDYRERAKVWLSNEYDVETRHQVRIMFDEDANKTDAGNTSLLEDSFYRNLEFGTGGLRGIMGAGTNRMNKYTVAMATQGFANYLIKAFADIYKSLDDHIKVAISFDSRNHSREFAKITANVFSSNGFIVYLFDNIRPTPELSFAIRELGCKAGVMVTASHNPKEYNGYKAYWEDGAQITAPHDKNIIDEVNKITSITQVKVPEEYHARNRYEKPAKIDLSDFGPAGSIEPIGEKIDKIYLDKILSLMLSPDSVKNHKDMTIVYTPLHGTGVRMVPRALKQLGFTNINTVVKQDISDGNFPTVVSPNPEEPAAMKLALALADKKNADLVMATDPDADRVGIAVRDNNGKMKQLNGNQTASILTYYILRRWKEEGKLNKNTYTIKTIVTTELLKAISESFGVECYDVLTGFKYICELVRLNEGKKLFIFGGEESYGYNLGEFVRDKDAVVACSAIAECAAWALDQGMSMYELLQKIYQEYGYYSEKLMSVVKKGKTGQEEIKAMMDNYRVNPPKTIAGSKVVRVIDCLKPEETGLPSSNVLRFFTEDESVVSVRPSGTEPKIKYYFGAKGDNADTKVSEMIQEFK